MEGSVVLLTIGILLNLCLISARPGTGEYEYYTQISSYLFGGSM